MPGVVVANPVSSILYDENGNKVGVIIDGEIYRLQVEATIASGHNLATEAAITKVQLQLYEMISVMTLELTKIRALMEHLTDEQINDCDQTSGDDHHK
jgi:hypothetical protein